MTGCLFAINSVFMKLLPVLLFAFISLTVSAAQKPDVEFRGILDLSSRQSFSLQTADGTRTKWVATGDMFAGYTVGEYRAGEKVLVLRKDGEEFFLSLGSGVPSRQDINSEAAKVHASNLRQMGQASLIFANDNDEKLPGGEEVATIHEVAEMLAREGGLNDATLWVTKGDAKSGVEEQLRKIISRDSSGNMTADPTFPNQNVIAVDYVLDLATAVPSTTPIAWTRGLKEDGTWDAQGTFGESGGFIVFMGGMVMKASEVGSENSPLRRFGTGEPTTNILEALPPGARVVGAGPGTLSGAIGLGSGVRQE